MADLSTFQSYADLRRALSPDAYVSTMNYLVWHNRLKMTAMLPVWQALAIGFLCDQRPVDRTLYRSIKAFLYENGTEAPESIDGCRRLADDLAAYLAGKS